MFGAYARFHSQKQNKLLVVVVNNIIIATFFINYNTPLERANERAFWLLFTTEKLAEEPIHASFVVILADFLQFTVLKL